MDDHEDDRLSVDSIVHEEEDDEDEREGDEALERRGWRARRGGRARGAARPSLACGGGSPRGRVRQGSGSGSG